MPERSRRCPTISRVLMPRAYIEMIFSSNPGKRRWYLAISCGSKQVVVHLGVQHPLGQRLLQIIKQAVRIESRLRIGASQKLVEDGVRNTRFFASRHGWGLSGISCAAG